MPAADAPATGPSRREPARARGPRGAYRKSAARRAEILDAALDVFAVSGYRAGSLREVATRVGLSEAGLLHHFPSKSALLAAVLARRDELSRVDVDERDGMATLRGLVAVARHNATQPGVVELFAILSAEATAPDHPAHAYFADRYADVRRSIGAAFEDLARRGLLAPAVDAALATTALVAVWDGLQVQWLYEPGLDVAGVLERQVRLLVPAFD